MSAHLSKLLGAGLVALARQGRHRYFRLADADVAGLLESLMGVAFRTGSVRLLSSPREPALRKARVCYDHLAGELGVAAYEALLRRGAFKVSRTGLALSAAGVDWFRQFGIDPHAAALQRRNFCQPCLDWSERRHHLAGALGAALWARLQELQWAARDKHSRVVRFTPRGLKAFHAQFDSSRWVLESG